MRIYHTNYFTTHFLYAAANRSLANEPLANEPAGGVGLVGGGGNVDVGSLKASLTPIGGGGGAMGSEDGATRRGA